METPPPGGYLWWYVDGLSDDGKSGISLIAFIGSVFSPYYYWHGRQDPLNHCSLNVALYGPRWSRWSMTERRKETVRRGADFFEVGPSAVRWEDDGLTLYINELSVPHLSPMRGIVRIRPQAVMPEAYGLDAGGRHWWRPVAPSSRIEVEMEQPDFRWSGAGYFDMNWGDEPLEAGFQRWDWLRAPMGDGAVCLYDATRRDQSALSLGLKFDGKGGVENFEPPPRQPLPSTLWRINRQTQADPGYTPTVTHRMEDAPFYSRSEIRTSLLGQEVPAVHESLDLDRFSSRWVKTLLPFRMPRRTF